MLMPTRRQLASAIRALAMNAMQKANLGYPGMLTGLADSAAARWSDHLKHNSDRPRRHHRERFLHSNGHGSMLPYLPPMEQLGRVRQLGSQTAGHSERHSDRSAATTPGHFGFTVDNFVKTAQDCCYESSQPKKSRCWSRGR
jgi:transketolase